MAGGVSPSAAVAKATAIQLLALKGAVTTAIGRAVLQCYYGDDRVITALVGWLLQLIQFTCRLHAEAWQLAQSCRGRVGRSLRPVPRPPHRRRRRTRDRGRHLAHAPQHPQRQGQLALHDSRRLCEAEKAVSGTLENSVQLSLPCGACRQRVAPPVDQSFTVSRRIRVDAPRLPHTGRDLPAFDPYEALTIRI